VLSTLPQGERKIFVEALAQLVRERLSQGVECTPSVRRREPRA
jgi:hypothetical protein